MALEEFVEVDVKDILVLFEELNAGAHGHAGKYSPQQLLSIKDRVEDAISFICEVVRH